MTTKVKITCSILATLWICSLFWISSITKQRCEWDCHYKASRAHDIGIRKVQRAISSAPCIVDSIWATEYLGIDILDTYFAKGTVLNDLLKSTISSEGLENGSYARHPKIHIRINGCDGYITVSMCMTRQSILEIGDPYHYNKEHKCYRSNEYDGDVFVTDCIICYSEIKMFSPKTSYEDVSQWIEQKMRSICKKITEKNKEVMDQVNESYFQRKEYDSYRFNPKDL